jgi:acetoin utilization deacetylase AcuC-like enzyme
MRTLFAYDPVEREHTLQGHPDNSRRLDRTLRLLHEERVLERMEGIRVGPVSDARLQLVPNPPHVERVRRACDASGTQLDADTYAVAASHAAARASAGALVGFVEAVMTGRARRGMSLMRRPGHHARPGQAMGFCIFGNVAVAAPPACRASPV